MGVISLERADSLFWLGRYVERVFTTVKVFFDYYDCMIDRNEREYIHFCEALSIPNVYQDREDFVKKSKMLFSTNQIHQDCVTYTKERKSCYERRTDPEGL